MLFRELLEQINEKLADNYNNGQPKDSQISARELIEKPFQKISKKISFNNAQRSDYHLEADWNWREETTGVHLKLARKEYRPEGQRYSWGKSFAPYKITVDEEYDFSKSCLDMTVEQVAEQIIARQKAFVEKKNNYRQQRIDEFKSGLSKAGITFKQFEEINRLWDNLETDDQWKLEKR